MKRQKHSLSYYKLFTCDMAELIPVACFPVIPGDTIQMATSLLMRVSPLLTPVMHPVSVRIHHWFVPNRLVWPRESASVGGWEQFITGGSDGEGEGAVFPTISFTSAAQGSLADYFGIPPSVASARAVSALPFRAYSMIWNEYYRDQDLQTARVIDLTGGADTTTNVTLAKCDWEKDYFTSARPWAQKGPEVTMPLGTEAPVKGIGKENATFPQSSAAVRESDGSTPTYATAARIFVDDGTGSGVVNNRFLVEQDGVTGFPNIYADLASATAVDVNTVRRAFALQRYEEARALYGSRYTEYLRYLGVRSSDARLQRPEYLGGGKSTISFSEVLQSGVTTSGTPNTGVGTMLGHGISAQRTRRWRRFFEEHGYVISLLSVRPRTMYNDGIEREWSKTTKEDFWQKELEHIGQQEVLNKEIYSAHATPEGTFGYQNRYAEYRHIQSKIAGEFRSTLNMWHYARIFGSTPALNSSFVECDPTKRVNQVTSNDVLWCMANNSIQARRLVSRTGIGRIL